MYKYRMGRFKDMRMSHMIADSHEELIHMAVALDLKMRWIQNPGTAKEHFDIPIHKRDEAIRLGAVPISMKDLVRKVIAKRETEAPGQAAG